jgi:hypothetical protein
MDELTARIEVLFLRYWAIFESRERVPAVNEIVDQFRADMKLLVAEYGEAAVNAAMDNIPNHAPPSFVVH